MINAALRTADGVTGLNGHVVSLIKVNVGLEYPQEPERRLNMLHVEEKTVMEPG